MAKKKSKLKKALALGAALAGGLALAKSRRHAGVKDQDDAARGVNWYGHRMDDIPFADPTTVRPDRVFGGGAGFKKGGNVTGIAKRGFGRALMKGKK
jgi:hypothetical protein